jgi:hypothetical protein
MQWVRSNIRIGAYWALLSLAIQFVVLFGHVHPIGNSGSFRFLPLSAVSVDTSAMPDSPSAPAKPIGLAFDYCAICAAMNLAASGVPPSKPPLPLPLIAGQTPYWSNIHGLVAALPHILFRSRAPPLA